MRRIGMALLLTLLVTGVCFAADYDFSQVSLDEAMADFCAQRGLDDTNFALSYENTVTGEIYQQNEQTYFIGGSIYKLPLCMLYRDRINAGEFTESQTFGRWVFSDMEREILVQSDNEMGLYLLRSYPSFRVYRTALAGFSGIDPETLDPAYYVDNNFCTDFFLKTLEYLYANADTYRTELDYLLQAQPGEYLKGRVDEYEIAQKYGWQDGAVNGVGIVYAQQPYLVAVFTQNVYDGAAVVAETNRLLCDYNDYTAAQMQREEEQVRQAMAEAERQAAREEAVTQGVHRFDAALSSAWTAAEAYAAQPEPEAPPVRRPTWRLLAVMIVVMAIL